LTHRAANGILVPQILLAKVTVMRRMILPLLLLPPICAVAKSADSPEQAMMKAAFPAFDAKKGYALWKRGVPAPLDGVFADEWGDTELRAVPQTSIALAPGITALVIGGTRMLESGPDDCHACSAMLTLIPMRMVAGKWQTAGKARDIGPSGAWGMPGASAPLRLAGGQPGISVETSDGGQGYSVKVLDLYRFDAEGKATRLTAEPIRLGSDSIGVAAGCDGRTRKANRDCFNISGKWRLNPANSELTVAFSGYKNGQKLAKRAVYRLRSGQYALVTGENPVEW
jgi:hypothetical protein